MKLFRLALVAGALYLGAFQSNAQITESNARERINSSLPTNAARAIKAKDIRDAMNTVVDYTARMTPVVTMSELRNGKTDSSRIVQVSDAGKAGIFRYDPANTTAVDDTVMVLRSGNKRYIRQVEGDIPTRFLTNSVEASFKRLVTYVGSNPVTVRVDRVIPITANYTIPENIRLVFEFGSGFNVTTGRTLTISGQFNNPTFKIFHGAGAIVAPRAIDFNPQWWGAASGQESADALQKCATAAGASNSNVLIPGGTFLVSLSTLVPDNVKISGSGWRKTIIRATAAITPFTLRSSDVLEDMYIQGQNLALKGIAVTGTQNRVNIFRVRVESCVESGIYLESVQNSLISEVMLQYNRYGLHLAPGTGAGPENCTFLNVNSNMDGTNAAQRGIYIENSRNCRFIGGIFERGNEDYQFEILNSTSLVFQGMDIQGGTIGNVYVAAGNVNFNDTNFALPLPPQFGVVAGVAAQVYLSNPYYTGLESRNELQRHSGNVFIANRNVNPRLLAFDNYSYSIRATNWGASSGGIVNYDASKGCMVFSGTSTSHGGTRSGGTNANIPAGTTAAFKFTLKNVSGGNGLVYLYALGASGTPQELIGTFPAGTHTFPYTFSGNTTNYYKFAVGQNASKTWELYDFNIETSPGVPSTLQEYNIKDRMIKATVSGNGAVNTFTVPHGLGYAPTFVGAASARNAESAAAGVSYLEADAVNITIHTINPLAAGTNNGVWDIAVQK